MSIGTAIIFALLLGLKLTGYAAISWLWVFSPIWIPLALAALLLILAFFIYSIENATK